MSLRFSEEGPAFPEQLVDSLLTGDVAFLCGAGISAPQLPDFPRLVNLCFERLNMEMNASDRRSFDDYRYEEVLGSLSRRIVDPTEFTETVTSLLRTPENPDLSHHHAILRLSRDLENRPVIITTNFDTMLEQAFLELENAEHVQALSFAGQDLPSPGSIGFGGIIHLHGRIDGDGVGLDSTPLVITSADYGDAYMRSGWASRFLFDLCRCKTIVLIGYSAGDAPVRYFLNVLEADRQRFHDLHHVYALTSVAEHGEADSRWEAVAVTPITYETADGDHGSLWRDLERLADVVERPRETRRSWAQEILAHPFSDTGTAERDRIAWLFNGQRDLWVTAIETIQDAAWLDFFANRELWSETDAVWVVASWMARDFASTDRFKRAIEWRKKLGKRFAVEISRRLRRGNDLPELWFRAWRLLSISQPERSMDWEERAYAVQRILQRPVVLHSDLEKAVDLLTPVLELTSRRGTVFNEPGTDRPSRVGHLAWPRLHVADRESARELLDALVSVPQTMAIMTIATGHLQSVVGLLIDIDDIRENYDISDFEVPSIEPHQQNEHRDGAVFLIELLARLLSSATEQDRHAIRGLAEVWRAMPGKLGIRLCLHSYRNPVLFTADEAMAGLASLSMSDFWSVRRELPLVLRDRARDADNEWLSQIEQRIFTEGDVYYDQYSIEEGQADWRSHARDSAVWLCLKMIDTAIGLTDEGVAELMAIQERHQYLAREVEDRDFFGSYSTGMRAVVADVQPILDAQDADRLHVAREAIQSPNIERQLGWRTYCRTDPRGAFDTLSQAPLDATNAPLWNVLLESLAFSEAGRDPANRDIVIGISSALQPADNAFLALIIDSLACLYSNVPWRGEPSIFPWWPRLFSTVFATTACHDTEPSQPASQLLEDAINSTSGRLTQASLIDIEELREAGRPIEPELIASIETAARAENRQGLLARAVLVEASGFVLSVEGLRHVTRLLDMVLATDSAESRTLRSVLVTHGRLTTTATRTFSEHVLRGVIDFDGNDDEARNAASKIIVPALSIVREDSNAAHWGLTLDDVARVLRTGPPALREGAAAILEQWITQIEGGLDVEWRTAIGPLLAQVWPRDRKLRDRRLTPYFANLAIKAEDAFPEALTWVLPYLDVMEGHGGTLTISESQIPEQFPRDTLTLLWKLFGIGCTGDLYGVPEILERLIASLPSIEVDRRLQWLNQRAVRYE